MKATLKSNTKSRTILGRREQLEGITQITRRPTRPCSRRRFAREIDLSNKCSHKSGRAFDTLFDYRAGGQQVLYISPERQNGRLFWRLYLRATRQDGSTGQPITLPVFNPSSRTLSPPPKGYFVDFTALAAAHGWRRIAAQERENFDWRSELLAQEYWHFERRDGLSWYGAVRLIHDDKTIARLFGVEALKDAGVREQAVPRLGLPWAPPPIVIRGQWMQRPQ